MTRAAAIPTGLILAAVSLVWIPTTAAQSSVQKGIPNFLGRKVTITEPATDENGLFPKGPASVCLEPPPLRQCYTAPQEFGIRPQVEVIRNRDEKPTLFFSAASGGVSGFLIHFALLQPGTAGVLEDIFPGISVSNQSEHAFWNLPEISDAPVFVTCDFVWGPDEGHYDKHRFLVSAYIPRPSTMINDKRYYLEDRYMTIRKYDQEEVADILGAEKQEILARLRKVKASRP